VEFENILELLIGILFTFIIIDQTIEICYIGSGRYIYLKDGQKIKIESTKVNSTE